MTSLIIPLYNHFEDVTKPFIEQLKKVKGDYEIIWVDNGSIDKTKDYFSKHTQSNWIFIHSSKNLGYGKACNLGFAQAKGEYICFMNNDIQINDPDFLQVLISKLKNNPDSLLGPHLVVSNMATNFKGISTPYLNGWCIFSSKKVFKGIAEDGKVFDEKFFLYFEDVELSARAVFKGYKILEVPLGIIHLGSKSSSKTSISKIIEKSQKHFQNKMMWMNLEKEHKKRIVFYFKSSYPFIDFDYEGKGVGGAEASLILLAREFAKRGWQTEIYNTTDQTGKFNGVEYHHVSEFQPWIYIDVFVLFREPYEYLPLVNAVTKIFWSCDQYTFGNWKKDIFPYVDKVVAISPYHKNYLDKFYGNPPDTVEVIELGVNISDYEEPVEKIPGKMIFCSVPRRGLEHMARLFPEIKSRVLEANLTITSDYRLWGTDEDNIDFKKMFKNMEGVTFLGKVERSELVRHQKEAIVMSYPCTYEECFCISAMECIAAGAIPVTTKLAALETTVGESGILLSNMPGSEDYDKQFVDNIVKLLTNPELAQKCRDKGQARAQSKYSYSEVCKNWAFRVTANSRRPDCQVKVSTVIFGLSI